MTTRTSKATEAAAAAARKRRHDKMAEELREAGRLVFVVGEIPQLDPRPHACIYATDFKGETHRVVGWTADHKPILEGLLGEYVGLREYVFTQGWRTRETAGER